MNFIPEEPNIFQGKQIMIDSDRLVFNARGDALLELPTEPAVLGHELQGILTQLLDLLDMLNMDMCFNVSHITTQPTTPTGMNPGNDTIYMCLNEEIQDIRNNLNDILSQNTKLV